MRKRLKELLILTFVLLLSVPTLIYCDDNNKVDRYSKSSILIDQTTNRVMFEKDPDAKRPLASLSKMMTFLIALEAIENKDKDLSYLNERVKALCAKYPLYI